VAEYNKKMYKEALATFGSGLSKRTDADDSGFISDMFALVGDIQHELGNTADCYIAYDSALVYNADNLGALNNYAYFLSLEGRELDKAQQMSFKTVEAEPENMTYIDTYMWILFVLERYDEAKAYAEKLLSLGEEDAPVVLEHCGNIFAKCGDINRAVELWSEAQKQGGKSKILEKKIKRRKYISDGKKKKKR
jgi:tetratricopeptide (TPR) repeat protein